MRLFSELYPRIIPRTPGAPEPLMRRECALAAQELCTSAHCWADWLRAYQAPGGPDSYELEMPRCSQVVLVTGATIDGRTAALTGWRAHEVAPEDVDQRGLVMSVSMLEVQVPGAAPGAVVKVRVVLMPTAGADGVPDDVMALYGQVIADGAIANLAMIPGQPFTSMDLAGLHAARFAAAIDRAHAREWRSRTTHTPRVRPIWC